MPSRPTNVRIAAFVAALAAGVLAGFELRPATSTTGAALAPQTQVAQVRTQIIRRTIHIVHHERPPRGSAGGGRPGGSAGTGGAGRAPAASGAAPRSRTSVIPAASSGSGVAAPRARTSGSKAAAPGGSGSAGAVRTTASGAPAGGSKGSVRTKSSGGGGDGGGGGHDD